MQLNLLAGFVMLLDIRGRGPSNPNPNQHRVRESAGGARGARGEEEEEEGGRRAQAMCVPCSATCQYIGARVLLAPATTWRRVVCPSMC